MNRRKYEHKFRVLKNFSKRRLNFKRQANRIIVVLILLAFILILKKLNNNTSSKIIQIIDNSMQYEFSIKKDGKAILNYGKKILTIPEKTLSVLNIENTRKYNSPIDGSVHNPFGETKYLDGSKSFNDGIDIIPKEDKEPVIIANGIVRKIEDKETKGYFVTVEHDELTTVYGYLVSIYLEEGEKVSEGSKVGTLGTNKDGNKYLHFETWIDNEPVNPLDYISFNKKL